MRGFAESPAKRCAVWRMRIRDPLLGLGHAGPGNLDGNARHKACRQTFFTLNAARMTEGRNAGRARQVLIFWIFSNILFGFAKALRTKNNSSITISEILSQELIHCQNISIRYVVRTVMRLCEHVNCPAKWCLAVLVGSLRRRVSLRYVNITKLRA